MPSMFDKLKNLGQKDQRSQDHETADRHPDGYIRTGRQVASLPASDEPSGITTESGHVPFGSRTAEEMSVGEPDF